MIELNTTRLKPGGQVQKNILYKIEDSRTVSLYEEHENSTDMEIVGLKYVLQDGQYAVLGKEYRSPSVLKHGCKSTDVLTCLIDDQNKKICSLILDIKKNISAFSDDLLKDGALLSAINEVSDFIEQLCYAALHKESFLVFHKSNGYTEKAEVGIATRKFEKEKFIAVADFLEQITELEKPSNMQLLLWYKFKNNLMPYVGSAKKMRDFANCKVIINGNLHPLQVYLLERLEESKYVVTIKIKLCDE